TPGNPAYAADLAERARRTPGVTLIERFVSDEEFDLWMAAADRLVLPYRRSWSSGILARAHALGTPAVVSAVGGLAEQADEHDVVVHDDAELARALAHPQSPAPGPAPRASTEGGRHHRHGAGAGPETDWDPEAEAIIGTRKGRT